MLDLVISNGQVVTPSGVGIWDVGILGEKIVSISEHGAMEAIANRIVDATNMIVVPGGIEPHAHIAAPIAGRPGIETAPPEDVSKAALFGGTTTITDFAIQHNNISIEEAISERTLRWSGKSYCDYSHHITMLGNVSTEVVSQIGETISDGFPTFKVFTTNVWPTSRMKGEERLVGMGLLAAMMEQTSRNSGLMLVHSEDDDIVQFMYNHLVETARTDWWNIHEVHNNMSEDISFRRVLRVSEWKNAATYFVHISAKEGADAIKDARASGMPIYGETLHNYLSFISDNYKEPDGMKYHTYPSLKSEVDQAALWNGVLKGPISCVATDEYCTTYELKTAGKTSHDVTGGHAGIETRLGIVFSEGVSKRNMSLGRFVEVTSTNAARILGYYPQKGVIAPGSDADIVLIDPSINKTLNLS